NQSRFETAIEAQHGGFPSRLLDVTYNALVALFFAVTPHYNTRVAEYDAEDGVVYIYQILKIYSPVSKDIQNLYDKLLDDNSILRTNSFFARNHKFLDHLTNNKRIVAQHGAFILFYGNEFVDFPSEFVKEIIISCNAKETIRKDLERMFGIHMGSMYPEASNFVESIKRKTLNMSNLPYSYFNEIRTIIEGTIARSEIIRHRIKQLVSDNNNEEFLRNDLSQEIDKIFIPHLNLIRDINKVIPDYIEKYNNHIFEVKKILTDYQIYLNNIYSYFKDYKGISILPSQDLMLDIEKLCEEKNTNDLHK
ncbi:FRG domain-containing protein, partial [bacterium]|nr:FRG domain-containing protein [bacterium]